MGKTAFMLQNMKAAASAGHPCGIISMEMSNQALTSRLLLAEAGLDSWEARTGQLGKEEIGQMMDAAGHLNELGIYLDDTTAIDPSLLRLKARMMKQRHGIEMLAIDYVQLMQADRENKEQEVAEISRTCKLLAKELDIPVIGLAQLSRGPEQRRGWDKRPNQGDLRNSGALEQDADCIMFLFRPEEYGLEEYPETGQSTKGVVEVIIGKHRNGPTSSHKLEFIKQHMSFQPISHDPVPHPADMPSSWYDADDDGSPF